MRLPDYPKLLHAIDVQVAQGEYWLRVADRAALYARRLSRRQTLADEVCRITALQWVAIRGRAITEAERCARRASRLETIARAVHVGTYRPIARRFHQDDARNGYRARERRDEREARRDPVARSSRRSNG